MGAGSRLAYFTNFISAADAQSRIEGDGGRIKMAIERKQGLTILKGVLNDHDALVAAPSLAIGIGDQAMADAVYGLAKILPGGKAPIFAGMEFLVAVAVDAEIATAACILGMGWVEWEIEQIHKSAGRRAIRRWVAEHGLPWITAD